jgi:hypothetical protein
VPNLSITPESKALLIKTFDSGLVKFVTLTRTTARCAVAKPREIFESAAKPRFQKSLWVSTGCNTCIQWKQKEIATSLFLLFSCYLAIA